MSISHWGIVPGRHVAMTWRTFSDATTWWQPLDFETWCTLCTREPIRRIGA